MIETRNLVHRYDETVAVDGVTLTIEDGEFLVLCGPNGSGKTTLIRHWNGLLEPDSGTVLVDGREVAADLVAARTAVGMVFQDPRTQLVAATVGEDVAFGPENLGLAREEIDRRVADALAAVNLSGRAGDRVETLSGGEVARAAIAGVLAMDPTHLVLDEPFAGLDWPARRSMLDRLATLHRDGTSVVVVTHDLRDVIDLADRVVVLDSGAVATVGAPDDVTGRLEEHGIRDPC